MPVESENEVVFDEKKFIDNVKMACLLCKRGFDSVELLNKHVQLSALNKVRHELRKISAF